MIGLVVLVVIALAVALKFGIGLIGSVAAENQNFQPNEEALKKASAAIPGHTPYGQKPKPGEIRPSMSLQQPKGY